MPSCVGASLQHGACSIRCFSQECHQSFSERLSPEWFKIQSTHLWPFGMISITQDSSHHRFGEGASDGVCGWSQPWCLAIHLGGGYLKGSTWPESLLIYSNCVWGLIKSLPPQSHHTFSLREILGDKWRLGLASAPFHVCWWHHILRTHWTWSFQFIHSVQEDLPWGRIQPEEVSDQFQKSSRK